MVNANYRTGDHPVACAGDQTNGNQCYRLLADWAQRLPTAIRDKSGFIDYLVECNTDSTDQWQPGLCPAAAFHCTPILPSQKITSRLSATPSFSFTSCFSPSTNLTVSSPNSRPTVRPIARWLTSAFLKVFIPLAAWMLTLKACSCLATSPN